jgi:hypothetical protein
MKKKFSLTCYLILFCICLDFGQGEPNPQTVQGLLQDFSASQQNSKFYTGASLPTFTHHEDTRGSRYLFDDWAKGTVVSANNTVIDNSKFLFNYDKISNNLFITLDRKTAIEVGKEEFKSFTLRKNDSEYVFTHVFLIDNHHFFQTIVKNDQKYSLYKLIYTKLVKSNYFTDGLYESGKPYDEYVDMVDYYVILPGDKIYKKVNTTRRSIKEILSMEKTKINLFISEHRYELIDENFLKSLVLFFNQ